MANSYPSNQQVPRSLPDIQRPPTPANDNFKLPHVKRPAFTLVPANDNVRLPPWGNAVLQVPKHFIRASPLRYALDIISIGRFLMMRPTGQTAWDADDWVGYGHNGCGGHGHTLEHMLSHLEAIGTGFAANCSFQWNIAQQVDAKGHMVGFEGTRAGNLRAMYRNVNGRLQLCQIVTAPGLDPTYPWPELKPVWEAVPMPHPMIRPYPASNPWAQPQGLPLPMPIPAPAPWARPRQKPEFMPGEHTYSGPRPAPRPRNNPTVMVRGAPSPASQSGTNIRPRPPGPGVKERKMTIRIGGAAGWIINGITEGIDFIDALHDALDENCKAKPKWKSGDRPGFGKPRAGEQSGHWRTAAGGARVYGYWQASTPLERAEAVYKNIECLNLGKAFQNLLHEQLEDFAYGQLGRKLGQGASRGIRPVGFQTGTAL